MGAKGLTSDRPCSRRKRHGGRRGLGCCSWEISATGGRESSLGLQPVTAITAGLSLLNGAGGGTRTRTDFRPTDFRTRYDFRRRRSSRRLESGLSLRRAVSGLGAARLVSTPSGETRRLGSGSAYVQFGLQLSPNLSGSASGVSAEALNRSSLLCLPVPPRPHSSKPCRISRSRPFVGGSCLLFASQHRL